MTAKFSFPLFLKSNFLSHWEIRKYTLIGKSNLEGFLMMCGFTKEMVTY